MSKRENKLKRVPKTLPKIGVELNKEQLQVREKFKEFDVNFVLGAEASGKTLVAAAVALQSFMARQFNKVVICRPIVENKLGFLPGTIMEKAGPWVAPIIHNLNMCQPKIKTDEMLDKGEIEILPVSFSKGITYTDSVVIIDEFEDLSYEDFRLILTRLGVHSKIIFCGSKEQIHRKMRKNSIINYIQNLADSGLVGYTELKSNHRNKDIFKILNFIENSCSEDKKVVSLS